MIVNAISAFILTAVVDILWAKYIKAVSETRPVMAGFFALVLYILGGTVTLMFVAEPFMIIPAACGAFLGTYLGVKK